MRLPSGSGQIPDTSAGTQGGWPAKPEPVSTAFSIFSGIEAQFVLGFVQLVGELFQLIAELALEFEHAAYGLGLVLGASRIEEPTTAQHGFFDLARYDWTDFAQIFADGLDFKRCAHEKFQVGFEIAGA